MTELVVRRLLVDLAQPMARHWCAGDAFRTALFNALSMSFPLGEQFFIDAVRDAHKALPPDLQAQYAAEVRGFVGQEATHRRIHTLFNNHLEQQGLRNLWALSIEKQRKLFVGQDPRHALAVTAANEHFTAMLAEWLLSHPEVLQGAEALGHDRLLALRALLAEVVEQSRGLRDPEELAHELQFLADNLDDDRDYAFMRP